MPVAGSSVSVTAATYDSHTNGSGMSMSSTPPTIRPDRPYGYADSCPAGTTTCSTVHNESNPASSAARPSSAAPRPVTAAPVSAKAIPYFMDGEGACQRRQRWWVNSSSTGKISRRPRIIRNDSSHLPGTVTAA